MKLTTAGVGDQRIDIDVDQNGVFSAEFNDQDYRAKTQGELMELLKRAVAKAKQQGTVDVTVLGMVPVTNKNGWSSDGPFEPGAGVVDAKLRGAHDRQHNVYLLVSDDAVVGKGKKFQVGGYHSEAKIARRLTLKERMDYLALREAQAQADIAVENFVGEAQIDPKIALQDARKAEVTK